MVAGLARNEPNLEACVFDRWFGQWQTPACETLSREQFSTPQLSRLGNATHVQTAISFGPSRRHAGLSRRAFQEQPIAQ